MYYGVIFIFPITLRHEGDSAKNMTGKVMIAASGELLGALSAIMLVDLSCFGTRRLLLFEQALAAIAFFSCAWISALPDNTQNRAIIFSGLYLQPKYSRMRRSTWFSIYCGILSN